MSNEYEKQAQEFLELTNSTLKVEFKEYAKYFPDDKESRNIFKITLSRNKREFKFTFGSSIVDTENKKAPTAYDILATATKYDPGTFENFCSDYGYDTDSRQAEKTYHAVVNEYNNLKMLYSDDELEKMSEIS